jgi:predicted Zn finger-like uncharacterized protein
LIVTCERCDTRFRLDESRLPARGARVRCSRCKHAFFVRPGGAAEAEAIHEVAENAATMMRPAAPEPSWDLDDRADPGRTAQRPAPAEPAADLEDESDWRFEDEIAQLGDSSASLDLPNGAAPPPETADPNESSFAALGDPESWDLSSSASNLPPLVAPEPAPEPPAAAPVERGIPVVREAPVVETPTLTPIAVEPVVAAAPPIGVEHALGLRLFGSAATALLVAWIVLASALPSAAPTAPAEASVALGPFAVEKLRAQRLDNALAGPLWVVRGELVNASGEGRTLDGRIVVRLLDADGDAIDAAVATARPPAAEQRVREDAPERIAEDAARAAAELAHRVLAPGARVELEAVFAGAPPHAARFALEKGALEPLPAAPPPSPARVEAPSAPALDSAPAAPPQG